jgi:hypothetical protein
LLIFSFMPHLLLQVGRTASRDLRRPAGIVAVERHGPDNDAAQAALSPSRDRP